jgi:Niemann-Pick C1 protein
LLDLWKYDQTKIGKLTVDDVLKKLNRTKVSPVTGHDVDYLHMLSGIERNATGHVVGAKAIQVAWMLYVNASDVNPDQSGNLAGTEDGASEGVLLWEQRFLEIMERLQSELSADGVQVYYAAGRSYGDVSAKAMFQDMDKLTIGITMMFIFMQLVLSKFSWVELRVRREDVLSQVNCQSNFSFPVDSRSDGTAQRGNGVFRWRWTVFLVGRLLWPGPYIAALPTHGPWR